jgi:hypothetical protein
MKDPRKRRGLSDTCHREPVSEVLALESECFNTAVLIPKDSSYSSLRSGPIHPRPEAVLVS